MRTVHCGLLFEIADSAMGIAYASTVAPGESFTTLELKINFLRPGLESKAERPGEGRSCRQDGGASRVRR
jgi:acyl-coenzyme A thioesterase PaaI-like protein